MCRSDNEKARGHLRDAREQLDWLIASLQCNAFDEETEVRRSILAIVGTLEKAHGAV